MCSRRDVIFFSFERNTSHPPSVQFAFSCFMSRQNIKGRKPENKDQKSRVNLRICSSCSFDHFAFQMNAAEKKVNCRKICLESVHISLPYHAPDKQVVSRTIRRPIVGKWVGVGILSCSCYLDHEVLVLRQLEAPSLCSGVWQQPGIAWSPSGKPWRYIGAILDASSCILHGSHRLRRGQNSVGVCVDCRWEGSGAFMSKWLISYSSDRTDSAEQGKPCSR